MNRKSYLTEIQPLSVIIKLLGWLPTTKIATNIGPSLKFCLFSWNFVYSEITVLFQLAVSLWILIEGFKIIPQSTPPHLHITGYFLLVYRTIPHFLPMLVVCQYVNQIKFVECWLKVQDEIEKCSISGEPIKFSITKNKLCIILLFIAIACCACLMIRIVRLQRLPHIEDLFYIIGFVDEILIFLWWNFTYILISNLSDKLLYEYQMLLEYNEGGKSGALLSEAVLNLRSPWLHLCNLRQQFGSSLSLAQGLLFIYIFTRLLFATYLVYNVMDSRIVSFCGIAFTISVFLLVATCNTSHHGQQKLLQNFSQALEFTRKLRITNANKDTMTVFLLHLIKNIPEISFSGYITVGRGLLTTLFSAFIAYVTVVLQLKGNEISLTYQDISLLNDNLFLKNNFTT